MNHILRQQLPDHESAIQQLLNQNMKGVQWKMGLEKILADIKQSIQGSSDRAIVGKD